MAKKNPELVPCPWCGAPVGERCATEGPNGRIPMQVVRAHASRYVALKAARTTKNGDKS